ncbi:uncharacterized protein LOC142166729 [Nicotiana tabacum]|uniref:Uncharacterized protein LOC142166729 n=1 Tax=Nicotiana tabacum TaxID=4097 RepID=A0AC58SAV7_TOBAC
MLDRLAGHEYSCFLDGYSGYNQIVICLEVQDKITFTCPCEVFMDDFSAFGSSYDDCLKNLGKVLARCEETNLVLNWEKLLEKDVTFNFDEACLKAFEGLKEKLVAAPIIVAPDWSIPFELICDASDHVVGAVLG